ncbi:MAG: hypothetical protein QOF78_3615 [Phycisphaerales bacterium]|jgi:hypothetical protein|nr:hypothetical protein [Phycisphaerales bacterium]MEA2734305.1 hypothetical protein [Humisphaera sp.]
MTPLEFLAFMLCFTGVAGLIQYLRRRRHTGALRKLAAEWHMHFSAADRFRLAPRIAQQIPVPGAAAVRVIDLLYGVERQNYRYIFATEYTTGVLRSKTGVRRVATFCEPREPGKGETRELTFAPEGLPVIDQYKHLLNQFKS